MGLFRADSRDQLGGLLGRKGVHCIVDLAMGDEKGSAASGGDACGDEVRGWVGESLEPVFLSVCCDTSKEKRIQQVLEGTARSPNVVLTEAQSVRSCV